MPWNWASPAMAVAASIADYVVVTSDNPRTEDPLAIIAAVQSGVEASGNTRALVVPDRREAIRAALAVAGRDAVVLVAGKGHETEQIFADRTVHFDDREVIRDLVRGGGR